ncbi:MAG: putative NTE family protein [Candidatus Anoxychlamydiales bacterium]|nr:putative NTE family protein [Candidatus Anoxychlamydiales bacterium]
MKKYLKITLFFLIFIFNIYAQDKNPKVALVLGAGGQRGYAHVGVLEVLEENNIPIDLIVGSSAGSMVGAFYAHYKDAKKVHDIFCSVDLMNLLNINFWTLHLGLSDTKNMKDMLEKNIGDINFSDLKIPFACIAADLDTGALVNFDKGKLIPSVIASCSVPFLMDPVKYDGKILVDGGIVDKIPVSTAKQYNPDVIIAIDIRDPLEKKYDYNIAGFSKRAIEIMEYQQYEYNIKGADIVIKPNLFSVSFFDSSHREEFHELGRKAALEMMPKILKLLKDKNILPNY